MYASSGFGALVGVLVSIIAGAFFYLVKASKNVDLFGDYRIINFSIFDLDLKIVTFISFAALLVLLTRHLFNITQWSGPADSIYAAHQEADELNLKIGFASTLAALISAAGNASVGQYGPLVHFGATAGTGLKRFFKINIGSDIVIGCGVAAAISAGFDAPIAGIIFAHEAILRHYSPSAMAPIATSAIVAAAIGNYFLNIPHPLALLEATPSLVNAFIPVVISGILFGLVAIAFMTSLRFFARMNARLNRPVYQSLTIAVLSVIGISIIIPEALGLGTQTLAAMLNTESSFAFVIFLLLAKILITSICLGFGFFGGVFFPSLLIGASAGVILAKFFSIFGYDDLSVSLALAGMASVAACVVGAPLATIFIVLELTRSYDVSLIALLAVIVSQVVSSNLFGNSFFDRQLLDRGIDLRFGRGQLHLTQVIVSDSTHADYVSAKPHWTAGVVLEKLNASRQTEAYCVSEGGDLEGKINIIGLLDHPEDTIVKDIMDPNPLNLCTDQSMLEAIKIASNFVGESIPVLQNDTRQMAGIITESDLFAVYLKIQSQVQDVER